MFGNLLMLVFGALCLYHGIKKIINTKNSIDDGGRKIKECTAIANGKVVDVVEENNPINLRFDKPKLFFVYEYEVGGQTYKKSATYGYVLEVDGEDTMKERNVGRNVNIYYNPTNPEDFYIPLEQDTALNPKVSIAIGVAFCILGLIISISSLLSMLARR